MSVSLNFEEPLEDISVRSGSPSFAKSGSGLSGTLETDSLPPSVVSSPPQPSAEHRTCTACLRALSQSIPRSGTEWGQCVGYTALAVGIAAILPLACLCCILDGPRANAPPFPIAESNL